MCWSKSRNDKGIIDGVSTERDDSQRDNEQWLPISLNAEDKGTESSMLESVGLRNKGLKGWTGAG